MHHKLAAALIRRGVIRERTILQLRPLRPYMDADFLTVCGIRQTGQRVVFDGEPNGQRQNADASQVIAVDGMQISRVAESAALDEAGNDAPQPRFRSPVDN